MFSSSLGPLRGTMCNSSVPVSVPSPIDAGVGVRWDSSEAGQRRLLDMAAAKYGPARLMMVWYGLRERMWAVEVYELLGIEVFKRLTASEGATKKSPAESSAGVSTTTKKRVLDSSAPFDGSTRPPPVGLSD